MTAIQILAIVAGPLGVLVICVGLALWSDYADR